MVDPFAMAATVLFGGPSSLAVTYVPSFGPPIPTRIVPGQPEAVAPFGGGGIVQDTNLFQLLKSDVASPQAGDQIVMGENIFTVTGVPILDAERISWNITAEPA